MTPTADVIAGLVADPGLAAAWRRAVPGGELFGIAGATASTLGSVVVVAPGPIDDAQLTAATGELAQALGVRAVELVLASGSTLAELVRDWTYQAAQGSGRGVHVRVHADGDPADGPVRVLVRAIDSSARELAFRLGSPQEPALPALRALLGGREVTVEDEETLG
ncbi:MAG TPA: hypothetical protein VFP72_03010 [Kineosporiaceae bacterium]|nr:hypothetical protein [Kineosporiaceae bacterium]